MSESVPKEVLKTNHSNNIPLFNQKSSEEDEINKKLDSLLLRHIELTQDYLTLSLKAEVFQKDGYLNLAKSRYIEGPNSMFKIRLPTEESEDYDAVITVTRTKGSNDDDFDTSGLLERLNLSENADKEDSELSDSTNFFKRDLSPQSDTLDNKLLKQFGILSPASVKQAQKSFRQSVQLSIDRVNVAEELKSVQKQFSLLHSVKNRSTTSDVKT